MGRKLGDVPREAVDNYERGKFRDQQHRDGVIAAYARETQLPPAWFTTDWQILGSVDSVPVPVMPEAVEHRLGAIEGLLRRALPDPATPTYRDAEAEERLRAVAQEALERYLATLADRQRAAPEGRSKRDATTSDQEDDESGRGPSAR